ncbi:MAG: hypothetical protein ACYS9X_04240 [Planctomycetota bacterium]|jgi:hypothetical protein
MPGKEDDHEKKDEEEGIEIGDESVVMGKVPAGTRVGNRSVYVAPTDDRGNVILNRGGLAAGYGAHADPTSIAIGAWANAGSRVGAALAEVERVVQASADAAAKESLAQFREHLASGKRDASLLQRLWSAVMGCKELAGLAVATTEIYDWLKDLKP